MDILLYPFFQRALLAVVIISIGIAIVGTYIMSRRMVFISGGITHACFGGLGLGYFLGVSPLLMATLSAVAGSLGVEWMSGRGRVRTDSAIAVVWAVGMALGILFIFLTSGYVPELNSFLFGNVLTVTTTDLLLFAGYTLLLLLFFLLFFRTIVAVAFDADFARVNGMPVSFINYAMTVFVAVGIVLSIRLVGIMLLMSLLTLPQMIAETWCRRFTPLMWTGVAVSVIGGVGGLFAAYFIGVPASATIVLLLTLMYAAARLIRR